jgi:hypothetical protein
MGWVRWAEKFSFNLIALAVRSCSLCTPLRTMSHSSIASNNALSTIPNYLIALLILFKLLEKRLMASGNSLNQNQSFTLTFNFK